MPQELSQDRAIASLEALANKLSARDQFSGVIVVQRDGKTLLKKAWGLADRESRRANTTDTPFFIASQGKMFTAVAILQLVEAGKLQLDDPIVQYLPDYPNHELASKVTVRHLLTHQGGTGDIDILDPNGGESRRWVRSIRDLIELHGKRALMFEPGSKAAYSNYGFILLGAVIEKVSGQSYYDYVEHHVFRPAGMNATTFPDKDHLADVAVGYTSVNGQPRPNWDFLPWRGMSAGGGTSTAEDMRATDANSEDVGLKPDLRDRSPQSAGCPVP
ncbi:MAG: serine hydrolase domain-containing protein [Steroidobacteraceae bacterium]